MVDRGAWRLPADGICVELDVGVDLTFDDGDSGPRWEAVRRAVLMRAYNSNEERRVVVVVLFVRVSSVGCDVFEAKGVCLSPTLPKTGQVPVMPVAIVMPSHPSKYSSLRHFFCYTPKYTCPPSSPQFASLIHLRVHFTQAVASSETFDLLFQLPFLTCASNT